MVGEEQYRELRTQSSQCEDWGTELAKLIAARNWLEAAKNSGKLHQLAQRIRITTFRIVEEELDL